MVAEERRLEKLTSELQEASKINFCYYLSCSYFSEPNGIKGKNRIYGRKNQWICFFQNILPYFK